MAQTDETKQQKRTRRSAAREPTQEEIERRAYELYLARDGGSGCDLDDWYQAERELREGRGTGAV